MPTGKYHGHSVGHLNLNRFKLNTATPRKRTFNAMFLVLFTTLSQKVCIQHTKRRIRVLEV